MLNIREKYEKRVVPQLMKEFKLKNKMAAPKVVKVVVSMGIVADKGNKEAIEQAKKALALITGQKPLVCCAKKSISGFSLIVGDLIGLKVTLRNERRDGFLDKLFNIVLPQVKDFRGLLLKGFDNGGSYTLGLRENTIFPEIEYDKIDRSRGLEITIVTNSGDSEKAKRLLELLGAPFEKIIRRPKSKVKSLKTKDNS